MFVRSLRPHRTASATSTTKQPADSNIGVSLGTRDTSEMQLVQSEHNIVKRESSSSDDRLRTQRLDQSEFMKFESVEETENSELYD